MCKYVSAAIALASRPNRASGSLSPRGRILIATIRSSRVSRLDLAEAACTERRDDLVRTEARTRRRHHGAPIVNSHSDDPPLPRL